MHPRRGYRLVPAKVWAVTKEAEVDQGICTENVITFLNYVGSSTDG